MVHIFPESEYLIPNIMLTIIYGYILSKGSQAIAEGSEKLMLVLDPGITGGLILPLLGALPDSLIVLFSCLGDPAQVKEQVGVGMGVLAGSTIMLLTVPLSISLFVGRCDFKREEGEKISIDKQCTGINCANQGVTCKNTVQIYALWMLVCSMSYLIIWIPSYIIEANYADENPAAKEKPWEYATLTYCCVMFVAYAGYMIYDVKAQEEKFKLYQKKQLANVISDKLRVFVAAQTMSALSKEEKKQQSRWLNKFVGSNDSQEKKQSWKQQMVLGSLKSQKSNVKEDREMQQSDEEGEEHETAGMTKTQITLSALAWMFGGTFVVAFFSDPMVETLTNLSKNLEIKAFYVSFVISPFASNASEIIAAIIFASKKKTKNITMTFSALYGACTMNSTMVLGLLVFLVAFNPNEIRWEFTAEIAVIVLITFIVGIIGVMKKTWEVFWAIIVISLWPLSIVLVYVLENVAGFS